MEKIVYLFVVAVAGAHAAGVDTPHSNLNRITNGNPAIETQFPYVVSLQQLSYISTNTRDHRCGGVLITLQHVLTAASCLFNTVNGSPVQINPTEYRVFAGSVNLHNDTSQDRIRHIANFTVHPEYVGSPASINDIAIITLTVPFLNSTVVPLNLPSPDFGPADFAICTVAGWGAQNTTSNGTIELRYTTKYIYSQSLCTTLYSTQAGLVNIFPTMLCAASYDIVSAGCVGDQGNPLVCNGGLAGILFQTNGCMTTSFPEVYTRVSNYTEWITSITGGASTFQPGLVMMVLFTIVQIITANVIS